MNEKPLLYGEDELRNWLTAHGFCCEVDPVRHQENKCNWYAYHRSELEARRCECNDSKAGVQLVVKPSVMQIGDHELRNVEIELRGEANGIWWSLSAYSLKPEEASKNLDIIETSLIAAWNALRPTCEMSQDEADRDGEGWEMNNRQGAEKFWMVAVTIGGVPLVKHEKKADAIAEAKRLALKTNERAYVLEAITAFEMPPTALIELEMLPLQTAPMLYSPVTGIDLVDPCTTTEWRREWPNSRWLFNPWTRKGRSKEDIDSDPSGLLIDPSAEAGQ